MLSNRKLWIVIAAIIFVIGIAGGLNIFINGEHATGTNDNVPWGSLIASYIFFVGASAGLSLVSSLGHVFNIEKYEVIGKRSLLAGIALLFMGFFVMAFELGQPLNALAMVFSPNISSAIFWMGVLYGLLLVLLMVEFYFTIIKDNHNVSGYLGLAVIIVDVCAHSNLGAVFGNIVASPYWNGPYIPIYLIILAILLGVGILAVMFYIVDRTNATKDNLYCRSQHIVTSLGRMMLLFIVIGVFFAGWNVYTNFYSQAPGQYESIMSMIWGPLSFNFWFFEVIIMFGLPALFLLFGKFQPKWVALAGLFTIVGGLFARFDIVFAGQIVPHEYLIGSKSGYIDAFVSLSEWALIIGAMGGSLLIYLIGEKLFDLNIGKELDCNKKHKEAVEANL